MRQLIAGNWKMNGLLEASAALAGALRHGGDGLSCDIVVCPPATMVMTIAHVLVGSAVEVGGQDCHARTSGPHTGDVSAAMLRDAGARWVILGHSERRADHGETSAQVRTKTIAAMGAGLMPIVCVGETEAQRMAGQAFAVVGAQLADSLPEGFAGVVAYEPVWAIGTGKTATEDDVRDMHAHIRGCIGAGPRILYGGSVKPSNAASLLAVPEVGGALVGGASLVAEDFLAIARAAKPA